MGNYNLKSDIYRCQNCYSILKISISPSLPESDLILECKCSLSNMALKNFLSELTQSSKHKILCTACHSKEEKNDFFCYDCNHIYCNKCINNNHKKHKYISLSKIDFYCIFHQKENFCAFCKECQINICKKCLEGKKHLNHNIIEYNKIMMNKTERNFLKDKLNLAQEKMNFNTQFVTKLTKKMKNKNDIDKIINLEKENKTQNKNIIDVIKFFAYLYDNSRYKNYNIIHNFVENVNLNVNKFKFWDKNIKIENAMEQIEKYFNEDFIIINDFDKNNKNKNKEDPMWDLDNEISTRTTMMNINKIELKIDEDINEKESINNLDNKMKKEEDKIKNNDIMCDKIEKNIIKNTINNEKINNQNDKNNYKRPRAKAIFIPSKIIEEKIKNKKEKEDDDEVEGKHEEINTKEEIKVENNININKGIGVENKINTKEEISDDKNIKDNIYINHFSINRFRNKYNSVINLMMINGFRKRKIYDINNDKNLS